MSDTETNKQKIDKYLSLATDEQRAQYILSVELSRIKAEKLVRGIKILREGLLFDEDAPVESAWASLVSESQCLLLSSCECKT